MVCMDFFFFNLSRLYFIVIVTNRPLIVVIATLCTDPMTLSIFYHFIHLFIYSFMHPYLHTFIHSFQCLFSLSHNVPLPLIVFVNVSIQAIWRRIYLYLKV